MAVGPFAGIICCAGFQFIECLSLEILYTTQCRMLLAVNKIPPLAHLEHVRTLVETVPHVGHENACMCPVLKVGRGKFGQNALASLEG